MRGIFITFEGVEGAGKSTQIHLVLDKIRGSGQSALVTREPGGCPLAERIRGMILETFDDPPSARCELLLLQAARAQHVEKVIRPALDTGKIVVCDRFYHSTMAYQANARGLDSHFVRESSDFAVDGIHPDLTLILDIPVREGLLRQQERNRMESESVEFHEAVQRGFQDQAAANPSRIKLIDAQGTVDEVHQRIWAALSPVLNIQI